MRKGLPDDIARHQRLCRQRRHGSGEWIEDLGPQDAVISGIGEAPYPGSTPIRFSRVRLRANRL